MSQGERAAEETKGFFKQAAGVTEGIRQNINSFADDLIGSKSNTHSNAADAAQPASTSGGHVTDTADAAGGAYTTGLKTGSHDHSGSGLTNSNAGSGIHPDAQKLGDKINQSLNQTNKGGAGLSG